MVDDQEGGARGDRAAHAREKKFLRQGVYAGEGRRKVPRGTKAEWKMGGGPEATSIQGARGVCAEQRPRRGGEVHRPARRAHEGEGRARQAGSSRRWAGGGGGGAAHDQDGGTRGNGAAHEQKREVCDKGVMIDHFVHGVGGFSRSDTRAPGTP